MSKKVAAVVVTYNRKDLLLECINSLLGQKNNENLDILIIDNASTDGTELVLKPLLDKQLIQYFNTGSNLGGAGGFQYGLRIAAMKDYQFAWLMDDDCIPNQTALDALLNATDKLDGNYGFLSSQVRWSDGSLAVMNIQRETMYQNVKDFDTSLVKITMASFVSFFIPIKNVLKEGLPIKEFFIWTDDWEYTRRLSRKYNCYLVNDSVVVHKSSTNIAANIVTDYIDRLSRYMYLYRNDVFLYRREGFKGILYEMIRLSLHSTKVLLFAKDNKLQRFKSIWIGTARGLSFYPDIEYID